jgi:DNA polymerase
MLDPKRSLWIDFETASAVDLKTAGAVRYAADPTTKAIVLAYGIDGDAPKAWHNDGEILDWHDAPQDLRLAFISDRSVVAWNAAFDREIWNYATVRFPVLGPERAKDAMAQATASGLPADLERASTRQGGAGKDKEGKRLIKLFCIELAKPADHPEDWLMFLAYARRDIDTMREVIDHTRPLSDDEWAEYHAFEAVNERGIGIDVPFVRNAARLAAEDRVQAGRRLAELTNGAVTAVTQSTRIAEYLFSRLPTYGRAILLGVADYEEPDDEDEDKPERGELSIARSRITALRNFFGVEEKEGRAINEAPALLEILDLREYGGGAAPAKFARMLAQHVGGVIANQYVFGGAAQTGRMSSRGIQIHNLTRDAIGKRPAEAALVDAIADGASHQAVAEFAPTAMPVARKLALMVRPAIVSGAGKIFTWSDWSAIEARVTPWLAASPSAETALDIFRTNDSDPKLPDIYMVAAAGIWGIDVSSIDKESSERQTGKVATLALGFGGGRHALQAMAVGYRVYLDDEEAGRIVAAWRAANPWAGAFWSELWQAALAAWQMPGSMTQAGRIAFTHSGENLWMILPSGRPLIYPSLKWREVPVLDDNGDIVGIREELSFMRPYGRAKLWHGTFCENAVQATAADILRGTVRRLVEGIDDLMPVRAHTHDEILVEHTPAITDQVRYALHNTMVCGFAWSKGLPLAAEEKTADWYSKAKEE